MSAIGRSLGGHHNALSVAACHQRNRAVMTGYGFTSFAQCLGGDLTGCSDGGYMPEIVFVYGKAAARMPFDWPALVQSLLPRALFINAPQHDANFDVTGRADCVRAARRVYQQVLLAASRLYVEQPGC